VNPFLVVTAIDLMPDWTDSTMRESERPKNAESLHLV
jgi:hypothetical protein